MPAAYGVYQHVAIGVTSGLLALTTFVVYVRLYIRCVLLNVGSTGWDDLTVFIAWKIMAVGASIATYFEVVSGLGRHIEDLKPEQVHNLDLSSFTVMQFYNVGISAVKISFLAQYYRLFPSRLIRRVCFCFGIFCFLWMFAQAVLYALSCVPIAGLVPAMADVCIPTLPTWTAISSVNAFSHLLIFCIPMKPLWGMSLLKRQRYLLIGIFFVGLIVCVVSIIRIPVLRYGAASPDPSFANVATTLWSLAELDTAILCASLPILRPLAARFIQGLATADAPANRLKVEPETGERHQAPAHSWSKSGELLVQAAPVLRGTSLDDSMPKSGSGGFLRSLVSGRRDGGRDRDRDAEELEEHRQRRAVPTTTAIEVDVPKECYASPLDSPVGTYKKSPLTQKPVPRAPLTFYPRDSMAKRPPVPIIQPMSPRDQMENRLPYDPIRRNSPIEHNRAQNQYQRQLYAPMAAPNTPRYSSSSKMSLSNALLKPPPSLDDSSFIGTLPLAGTPSPPPRNNNTTRHHYTLSPSPSPSPHHHHRPRVDSFTLSPPCPNHPTTRQVCSRCALNRRPLPPTPIEAEETEQAQQTTTRVWVARSTQTVVTWGEPAVQTGEVVGGRGVHLVDVVEGDKPRSWRGQMVPTPPVDEETGSSANSRIDPRGSRGEEGERQGREGTRMGSGAEENSPRTRHGRERVASETTVGRRSESGRRGAGTSWLRLSTGSGR